LFYSRHCISLIKVQWSSSVHSNHTTSHCSWALVPFSGISSKQQHTQQRVIQILIQRSAWSQEPSQWWCCPCYVSVGQGLWCSFACDQSCMGKSCITTLLANAMAGIPTSIYGITLIIAISCLICYSTEKLGEGKSLFFNGPGRIYKASTKIYAFRDTVLNAIMEYANAVLRPGVHSNAWRPQGSGERLCSW